MSLQESYGFDAFCQELIQQWPAVSLSFRRTENRLFVTAASLGVVATAVSHDAELAGSTVRRAVADLHARLVVRGPTPTTIELKPFGRTLSGEATKVLALAQELRALNEEIDELEEHGEELSNLLSSFLCGDEPELLDEAVEAGKELPLLPGRLKGMRERAEALEEELNGLDPDGDIEFELAEAGCLN